MKYAIIGCGHIAQQYAADLAAHANLRLAAAADLVPARAAALTAQFGGNPYPSAEALLAGSDAELILNLTIHDAHAPVTRACLAAGRHVFSEKPLALDPEEAAALVALAQQKGLALGCAPGNLLSDAAQFTWELLREGRLGTVRMIYADGNFGRVTQWNANPEPFLRIGPLFDGAVYPLALLTAYFGPVVGVHAAHNALLLGEHEANGRSFHTTTPDHTTALLELSDGPLLRLTASMYVPYQTQHFNSIEFHGDGGSLYLRNCGEMSWSEGAVAWAPLGEGYAPLPLPFSPQSRDYAAAVAELATAVAEDRRPRAAAGAQAAHLVDVIDAINRYAGSGEVVAVRSGFMAVAPIPR